MAKKSQGATAPFFAYQPKLFFKVIPYPEDNDYWVIVNIRGTYISDGGFPLTEKNNKTGVWEDHEGSSDFVLYFSKKTAEQKARELNESLIFGFILPEYKKRDVMKELINRIDYLFIFAILAMLTGGFCCGIFFLFQGR